MESVDRVVGPHFLSMGRSHREDCLSRYTHFNHEDKHWATLIESHYSPSCTSNYHVTKSGTLKDKKGLKEDHPNAADDIIKIPRRLLCPASYFAPPLVVEECKWNTTAMNNN